VPRRARLVAFPPALGVNAGRNDYGVEVQKDPQPPAVQVPWCRWAQMGSVPAQSIATGGARRGW
jgi:hypothetical protein